jgi:hypothetical protein
MPQRFGKEKRRALNRRGAILFLICRRAFSLPAERCALLPH